MKKKSLRTGSGVSQIYSWRPLVIFFKRNNLSCRKLRFPPVSPPRTRNNSFPTVASQPSEVKNFAQYLWDSVVSVTGCIRQLLLCWMLQVSPLWGGCSYEHRDFAKPIPMLQPVWHGWTWSIALLSIQGCPKVRAHFHEAASQLAWHPESPAWIPVREKLLTVLWFQSPLLPDKTKKRRREMNIESCLIKEDAQRCSLWPSHSLALGKIA